MMFGALNLHSFASTTGTALPETTHMWNENHHSKDESLGRATDGAQPLSIPSPFKNSLCFQQKHILPTLHDPTLTELKRNHFSSL